MIAKKIISLLALLTSVSFINAQQKEEEFEIDDDGITVERFNPSNKDENRYNQNNKIYKVGRKFTFTYCYADKNGNNFLVAKGQLNDQRSYDWKFENQAKKENGSVYQIELTVKSGLSPFIEQIPDYNQTIIKYDYIPYGAQSWVNEMTGLIENSKNVWMHPPRSGFFKILEINPFPYIKAPYTIGNQWTWKLKFGDHWSDPRWLSWKGSNENIYTYRITDRVRLATKVGDIDCYVIVSEAKSNIGTTKLISYFNEEFGFVKLDYTNIDGTKTFIELEKVE